MTGRIHKRWQAERKKTMKGAIHVVNPTWKSRRLWNETPKQYKKMRVRVVRST